jgi:hypothetical protein
MRIVEDGEWRLREALKAQVWREHQEELSAPDCSEARKVELRKKIEEELKRRLKRYLSPYSLYAANSLPRSAKTLAKAD